ncbi:2-dehydropantoate 2-reductase [Blastococcus sp. MG754426]|uniref:ketopantoate reductase family protein n=1 Tax=unclassified Blastococcus TaxID=2619396 RepID=UPI001EF12468|nr:MULTISPECIES: 2-dehydropantoate 2-reductase [unclassified Blastococcus]MCF6507702.1 2-dehydropantoate 2-reductase [Blastococcus sp. MG754426]MCF6511159.1 2-dehydropantoate 2-reductase [Blastococcus sp. MG754427]
MTSAEQLRIAVLGPGGVGGLLAALLARAGHAVTCLARPATAAHLGEQGLHVTSDRYGELTARVRGAERLDGPVDVLLVTTKATQLDEALDRVPAGALGGAVVVPLLNGVEHLAALRGRYPAARVVAGTIRVFASRPAPGEIRHEGQLCAVQLAPGAEPLAAALTAAGVDVAVRPDEAGLLWDKLCFLAPMALLTTRHAADLGAVREQHGAEFTAVIAEVAAVARAEGAAGDAAATQEFAWSLPGGMRSSMQRDAEAGLPTELEAIGGAVLRAADRHGVDVPATRLIVEELRARLH